VWREGGGADCGIGGGAQEGKQSKKKKQKIVFLEKRGCQTGSMTYPVVWCWCDDSISLKLTDE